ncbi:MAG TPA: S-adenosylmethionine:tRNA ribosyltransferase-isomerase, partial [Pseudonocardiaceae bacterium]|nr:S-adenosylmethionine:tRNA ribosyltransferase-isomerase [Pseudonocardiaceae bacterium]
MADDAGWRHAPEASHLALLEAVPGTDLVDAAYRAAVAEHHLWHEFGDSMLFLPRSVGDAARPPREHAAWAWMLRPPATRGCRGRRARRPQHHRPQHRPRLRLRDR